MPSYLKNALRLAKGGEVTQKTDVPTKTNFVDPATGAIGQTTTHDITEFKVAHKAKGGGAWTRKEGKNPEGGLNAKSRTAEQWGPALMGQEGWNTAKSVAGDVADYGKEMIEDLGYANGGSIRPALAGGGGALKTIVKAAKNELTNRKLPDRLKYAINQYSGSGYESVNQNLRGELSDPFLQSHASSIARNLQLGMSPLQSDMTVYRGVESPEHIGDSKAFSSTSLQPETARMFAGDDGHVMKLRLKAGTPVSYGDVAGEQEIILPPGKIGINRQSTSGPYTYHHGTFEPYKKGGEVDREERGPGGKLLSNALRLANPIRAFHGSPHKFDAFDIGKIGTGEGSQNYVMFSHDPVEILRRYNHGGNVGKAMRMIDRMGRDDGGRAHDFVQSQLFSGEPQVPQTNKPLEQATEKWGNRALGALKGAAYLYPPTRGAMGVYDAAHGLATGNPYEMASSVFALPGKAMKAIGAAGLSQMPEGEGAAPAAKIVRAAYGDGFARGGYATDGSVEGDVQLAHDDDQTPSFDDSGSMMVDRYGEDKPQPTAHDFVQQQLRTGEPQLPQYDKEAEQKWKEYGMDAAHLGAYATPLSPYVAAYDTYQSAKDIANNPKDPLAWGQGALGLLGMPGGRMAKSLIGAGAAAGAMSPQEAQAGALSGPLGKAMRIIRAYHGSPHKFDKFDISKIGTGEGGQAYGRGLYFAGNEDVAKSYRDALSRQTSYDSVPISNSHPSDSPFAAALHSVAGHVANGVDPKEAMALESGKWRNQAQRYLDFGKTNPQAAARAAESAEQFNTIANEIGRLDPEKLIKNPGHMYEVNLHADPEHLLDWDKPLYNQSEHVKNVLDNLGISTDPQGKYSISPTKTGRYTVRNVWNEPTGTYKSEEEALRRMQEGTDDHNRYGGMSAYTRLGGNAYYSNLDKGAASNKLLESGIPGIKYLDQGSRGAGKGSHNYVMFSHEPVEILRRYKKGGDVSKGARKSSDKKQGGKIAHAMRLASKLSSKG